MKIVHVGVLGAKVLVCGRAKSPEYYHVNHPSHCDGYACPDCADVLRRDPWAWRRDGYNQKWWRGLGVAAALMCLISAAVALDAGRWRWALVNVGLAVFNLWTVRDWIRWAMWRAGRWLSTSAVGLGGE